MSNGNIPPIPMGYKPKEETPAIPKGYTVPDPVKKKEVSVAGTENTSPSKSQSNSTFGSSVGITERVIAGMNNDVDPSVVENGNTFQPPAFLAQVDFRKGYIPQVSRNPNSDVPSVQKAKSSVLALAEKQAQVSSGFSEVIGNPVQQDSPEDQIAKNMQQAQIRAVQAGDIDAIIKVIQNEKLSLKRDKENLPARISSDAVPGESIYIGENYESPETKLANEQREAKIKELDQIQSVIIDDGLKVVANTLQKEYAVNPDKSVATQKALGEKYRKAATAIQAKNADGTIDNYADQNNQAEFLLRNKYDKSIGMGRIDNTDDLQSKYRQELDFSNQATFLGTKASTEYEDVQEYLKNEDVVRFISPTTTDAERAAMRDNPMIVDFINAYSTLNKTMTDVKGLPALYPKVQQQLQAEKVFQAFGDYVASRRKTVAGEAVQNVADVFSGYELDEESEFAAVAELTGMSVEEVRQVAKDNPASAYIPSHLRKVVNSASGVLNGIEQSFNRAVLPNAEAGIVNREISSEVFKTPEAFRLKDNNITIRSVMDGMANGTGQFLGYAGISALGGEVLAIPKSAGLFSEASILARSSGVPVANLSVEAANLVKAMDKVKTVAGTFGVGYASSYEAAYKEASRYTNNEEERKAYAEGDAFFNGISELILPDVALARQLGKSGTSKVLAALKSGKPLSAAEALLVRFGEGAKVIGLETAEEMIPLAYDVYAKDKIFDYQTSSSELMKQVYETALVTAVSTVPMALGAGFRSPTSDFTKSALYNAGLNQEKFTTLINDKVLSGEVSQGEANKQIQTINTMAQVVKEVEQLSRDEGFEDDTKKKTDLAAQLLRKRTNDAIAETITDETQKKKYEADNSLADEEINKIITPNIPSLTEPEQVIIDAANKGAIDGENGVYTNMVKADPTTAGAVLLDLAKQKYGIQEDGSESPAGGRSLSMNTSLDIEEAVDKAYPNKEAVIESLRESAKAVEVRGFNTIAESLSYDLVPLFDKMNNAEYINENEISATSEKLYDVLDRVEKSGMTADQKQSSINLIEPLITKLEGYEFTTKTENSTTTEKVPTGNTNKTKREIRPALEQSAGSQATVTLPDGSIRKGTLNIKSGSYVLDIPKGQQIVVGEKAITDRDLKLPSVERVPEPIQFDADGNVASVTFETRNGNLVTIEDPERALDIAIQLQAEALGEIPDGAFQPIYDEVVKTIPVEVLKNTGQPIVDNQNQGGQNAVQEQSPAAVPVQSEASISKKVEEGKPESKLEKTTKQSKEKIEEETKPAAEDTVDEEPLPPDRNEAGAYEVSGEDMTGITHAQTETTRERFSLPEYDRNPETVADWDAQADEKIRSGYNVEELLQKMERGVTPSAVEQRIMLKYIASVESKIDKDPSDENLSELKRAVQLSDRVGGSDIGKALVARKGSVYRDDSLGAFFLREMEETNTDTLTEAQKSQIQKEYDAIKKANEALQQKYADLQEENNRIKAGENISKERKRQKSGKKSNDDFKKERDEIKKSIQEKLKKARQDTSVTILPYAKELFAVAPDVAKLVRSYVEEGIVNLSEIIDDIHANLVDAIPQITKKDVQDIIAGEYNEPKKTQSELAIQLRDLKSEAQLLNEYEKLLNSEVPVKEREQRKRNQKLTDLKNKIKSLDLSKLQDAKDRMKSSIKRIEAQIASGDFATKKKENIKLDTEGLQLQDDLIKLKQDREVRILKERYAQKSKFQKSKDKVLEVANVPRSIMASMDFSAPLRQAFIATVANPKLAAKAGGEMFKSAFSQKNFDRWFDELKNDPRYDLMKETRLAITDPKNPSLIAREEEYMNNLAEKIPFFGKLIKGSERAYVQYLNKMRVDLFNKYADRFEEQGKSFENSPELYKKMAGYINNITGRGSMGKLENSAPVLNTLLFSPRLIASRLNLMNPIYLAKLPTELKKEFAKDILITIGTGLGVVAGIAYAGGGGDDDDEITVETDSRSSDFMKIRQGNTRWDVWGGFQPYIRVISQLASGSKKTTDGREVKLKGGGGLFGKDYDKTILNFFRAKLAPIPGGAINVVTGKNIIGEKVTLGSQLLEYITPLNYTGIQEAMKDQGVKAVFTVGLPATFGVGTQTFGEKDK